MALLTPIIQAAAPLRELLTDSLDLAGLSPQEKAERYCSDDTALLASDLKEMAVDLLEGLVNTRPLSSDLGVKRRHEVAKLVESLLWLDPVAEPRRIDLDFLSTKLGCSYRNIQLAVTEHFNIGFVALKRSIRLHQFRRALISQSGKRSISAIAFDYEFSHLGNMSRYYKKQFGETPTETLNKRKP